MNIPKLFKQTIKIAVFLTLFFSTVLLHAQQNYYVDVAGVNNAGNGAVGSPYLTLKFALPVLVGVKSLSRALFGK